MVWKKHGSCGVIHLGLRGFEAIRYRRSVVWGGISQKYVDKRWKYIPETKNRKLSTS